jgi:DNA modification methylase
LEGFESKKPRTSMSIARGYCKNTNQVYEKCQCGNCDIEYINNETNTAQNTHPTGKPISLYTYLINLFTQPHDLVLDPYCGSGTTPIACVLTNRHYIGLELEKEYFDIAEARVKYWQEQKEWQANKTSKEEGTLI